MKRWAVAAIAAALAAAVALAASMYAPVVSVEIVNEGTTPDEATYAPAAIIVQPRTTVVWTNTDASAHTVTSRSPSATFDSGVMGPGQEFEFTFEDSRTYEYYCKIHPMMTGSVLVQ